MSTPPATPKDAASVLVVRDDPFRVLLVRRNEGPNFASALVFPGGVVDPPDRDPVWTGLTRGEAFDDQDRVARIAGARETLEESGILLATVSPPAERSGHFADIVRAAGGLDLDELVPFGRWVTPAVLPRRWDTRFFLARLPDGEEAVHDGRETVEVLWVEPSEAIDRAGVEDLNLLFPTLMNLHRLAESEDVTDALARAAARPRVTVHARMEIRDGHRWHLIDDEAGYPFSELDGGPGDSLPGFPAVP